ncbi:MAG: radical SAM protein [Bacteroidales bacterium]|nr:radical SAM protein [Bacteroidales bacterium]
MDAMLKSEYKRISERSEYTRPDGEEDFKRCELFRLPWSQTDNPGAWIEVTDICNFSCPGCFRKNGLTGHRDPEEIKKEILFCREKLNCSRICISGGEPLLYPHIQEIISFISSQDLKPVLLSNAEFLTPALARALKKAGLAQFYLHVDSGQNRPGWQGKSELEMNALRQHYTDLVYENGRIGCGYNLTVRNSNLDEVHHIVDWFRKNISRLNHLSLIAYRGIPKYADLDLIVNGKKIDISLLSNNMENENEIGITTNDIYRNLGENLNALSPAAYLNGIPLEETYKYLITINVGTDSRIFGTAGARTVSDAGRFIFIMALFDKKLRNALKKYLRYLAGNPLRLFDKVGIQALILQQPFEIKEGVVNLCDGCVNLMPYKGKLINSCRYDEYRLYGGPIMVIKHQS